MTLPPRARALIERAHTPRDAASLVAFRVLFGLLAAFGSARFLWNGWVERFFVKPTYFFSYWGFEWVQVLPGWAMHAAFIAMTALGLMIALGLLYRPAIVLFFVIFTYVELVDVTNYLNHYYLMSLLALLLCFLPLHRAWSLDALWRPKLRVTRFPAWMTWLLRAQVAAVYFNAGLAKLGEDWLIHAQPLNIWLISRADLPILGALFGRWDVALAMSWAGFLFDTTIVAFLLWPRSRPLAYAVVLTFHLGTHLLFNIGMFPLIMVSAATVFFAPDWPKRAWAKLRPRRGRGEAAPASRPSPDAPQAKPVARPGLAPALVMCYAAIQFLMPLRTHLLYGGDVLWHEQGMRWAWRVMVREKNGSVTYRARWDGRARDTLIAPTQYLTSHQAREMSGQPDLILRLGQHIGRELAARGHKNVQVRVDAIASLNGRPPAPLIDPDVDLMTLRDGIAPARWILPAPTTTPPRLSLTR